jgi:phage terminase large subunit GpA-like protein
MFKFKCPKCNQSFWMPLREMEKKRHDIKWYQFTKLNSYCPHCHARLAESEEYKRHYRIWLALIIPIWFLTFITGWPRILHPYRWVILGLVSIYILFWHPKTVYVLDERQGD